MWGLQQRTADAEPGRLPPVADALTVNEIIARIAREHEDEGRPSPLLDHGAPRGPITVDQARTLMQQHRPCSLVVCPAKREAYLYLVDQRVIVPTPRHGRLDVGATHG